MYGAAGFSGGSLAATGVAAGSMWLVATGLIFMGVALIALVRPNKKDVRP